MTIIEGLELLWQFVGLCVACYWLSYSIARGWKNGKGASNSAINVFWRDQDDRK